MYLMWSVPSLQQTMADSPTLDDLLKGVSRNSLKAECSDDHLIMIAKWFKHWKDISPDLGLTEAEEEEIEARVGDLNRKKLDMLRKWKSKYVAKANYLKLAEVFHNHGYNDLVVKLCGIISCVEDDGKSLPYKAVGGTERLATSHQMSYCKQKTKH